MLATEEPDSTVSKPVNFPCNLLGLHNLLTVACLCCRVAYEAFERVLQRKQTGYDEVLAWISQERSKLK